jgi:hypothetical protein
MNDQCVQMITKRAVIYAASNSGTLIAEVKSFKTARGKSDVAMSRARGRSNNAVTAHALSLIRPRGPNK